MLLTHATFENAELFTIVVASSFCNGDCKKHMHSVTHMRRVEMSLAWNSDGQFIFIILLNVFDSSPYGNI
jgi:hypothetical protein